ncbi:Cysteine dioxygenase type I [Cupriavidus sp. H19C3]
MTLNPGRPAMSSPAMFGADLAGARAAQAAQAAQAALLPFAHSMEAALADSARRVSAGIETCLPDAETLLAALPPGALDGDPTTYTRHLLHGDPFGRFSVMLLVWRPGQTSPVHGHRAWCAYRVLRGNMTERHYRWDPATRRASLANAVPRAAGDTFSVPAGLRHIHALANTGDEVAVTLHVYGVEAQHIATGVNLLVETAPS